MQCIFNNLFLSECHLPCKLVAIKFLDVLYLQQYVMVSFLLRFSQYRMGLYHHLII